MRDNDDPFARTQPVVPTATSKEAEVFDTSAKPEKRKNWLDPIGMSQLKRAVEKREKTVFIHGREYTLEYDREYRSEITDNYELVMVMRKDGVMAPFGYVSLDRILKFDFEAGE